VIDSNGKGKSTLLNLLSGGLKPVTGELKAHPDMKIGYFGQTNNSTAQSKVDHRKRNRTHPSRTDAHAGAPDPSHAVFNRRQKM